MTNLEKIKSMKKEEFAYFLHSTDICEMCCMNYGEQCEAKGKCKPKYLYEWLEKEYVGE